MALLIQWTLGLVETLGASMTGLSKWVGSSWISEGITQTEGLNNSTSFMSPKAE